MSSSSSDAASSSTSSNRYVDDDDDFGDEPVASEEDASSEASASAPAGASEADDGSGSSSSASSASDESDSSRSSAGAQATPPEAAAKPLTEAEAAAMPKTGVRDIPIGLTVAVLVVLVVAAVAGMSAPPFSNGGTFMMTQLTLNFSLLILLSFGYGLFCVVFGGGGDPTQSTNPMVKYQHLFLPIVLIVVLWLKNYMTYSSGIVNYCAAKNAKDGVRPEASYRWDTLLWNTSKVPIAIFVTYIFILLFPWTLMPFFQLFDSTHTLVFFFGVGFWTGCASWASEASCYFELMRYGCAPAETVDFKSIDATIEEAEAAAAADGDGA
jgi:hypothetical protein